MKQKEQKEKPNDSSRNVDKPVVRCLLQLQHEFVSPGTSEAAP